MFFVRYGLHNLIDVSLYKNFRCRDRTMFAIERATNEERRFELEWDEEDKDKAFTRFCECVMLLNTYKEDD